MTSTPEVPVEVDRDAPVGSRSVGRRAPLRWWLLATVAIVLGASLGTTVARANRTVILGTSSSNVVTSTGGTFTRIHATVAPSFHLVDLENPSRTISLNQFHGHFVIVNFWASWCPPCRKEMPTLADVAHQLASKVDFVGLDTQDERSAGLARMCTIHSRSTLRRSGRRTVSTDFRQRFSFPLTAAFWASRLAD